jgi:type IX secretion system PorP/SprF family membrane protein
MNNHLNAPMRTIVRFFGLPFLLMLPCSIVVGQDIEFTQYQNTPIYYNPAQTGAKEGLHTNTLGRFQWPNLQFSYNSFHFEGDFGMRSIPGVGGFGVFVSENCDNIGFMKNFLVGASLSSRINIASHFALQFGMKGSMTKRKVNWDNLIWQDQMSELYGEIYGNSFEPPAESEKAYFDMGVGGLFQFKNESSTFSGSAGFAVDHLFQPDISLLNSGEEALKRKYVVTTDFFITTFECSTCKLKGYGFKDPLTIAPGLLYQNQNGNNTIQVGSNLTKFNFSVGFWYRYAFEQSRNDAYSFLFGYRVYFSKNASMNLSYNFDLNNQLFDETLAYTHLVCLSLHFNRFGN